MDAPGDAGAWWLYLLECGDGSWYAGISNDLDARLRAHAEGKGARYTRGRGPLRILARRAYPDRAAASRAEYALKRLPKARKVAFFASACAGDAAEPGSHATGPRCGVDGEVP